MNTIILKNADFSEHKVGKLNIQRLDITNAGSGYAKKSGTSIVVDTGTIGGMDMSANYAHSNEVTIPSNAKFLFARINSFVASTNYTNFVNNSSATQLSAAFNIWCVNNGSSIYEVKNINLSAHDKLMFEGVKENAFVASSSYNIVLTDGELIGVALDAAHQGTAVFNWFKKGNIYAPELGLDTPDIWIGF